MDVDRLIGWNLARIRTDRDLSQDDAADLIENMDQPLISKIENGNRTINVITLYRIGLGLNINPGELYRTYGAPADIIGDLTAVHIPNRRRRRPK
jgi:transcriptional regulator with XRE-family HTH domain